MSAPQQPLQQQQPAGQEQKKDDLLDKAFAMGQKKVNPNGTVDKQKNEKITDFLRKMIEKFTGKKLPAKVSN